MKIESAEIQLTKCSCVGEQKIGAVDKSGSDRIGSNGRVDQDRITKSGYVNVSE